MLIDTADSIIGTLIARPRAAHRRVAAAQDDLRPEAPADDEALLEAGR